MKAGAQNADAPDGGNSGGEIRAIGADVDVQALMGEIRTEVRRRREAGEYPDDVALELDLHSEDRETSDVLTAALAELSRSANFTSQVTVDSKRVLVGPLVSRARRVIRASITWYFNGILDQINRFSRNVERSITILAETIGHLNSRMTAADKQVNELTRWADAVDERQLAERLEILERSVEELRSRLGTVRE